MVKFCGNLKPPVSSLFIRLANPLYISRTSPAFCGSADRLTIARQFNTKLIQAKQLTHNAQGIFMEALKNETAMTLPTILWYVLRYN
jgi:hypothetical protein